MADYYIDLFLDDEKIKKVEGAGLAGEIREVDGKKAVQVGLTSKEQKKLVKGLAIRPRFLLCLRYELL